MQVTMRTLSKAVGVSFLVFFGWEFSVAQANNNNNNTNASQANVNTAPAGQPNQPAGGPVLGPSSLPPDGAYVPQDASHRRVVPPAQMRAADIMWKERIWRVINTKEKMNQDLYYPLVENSNRISLFDVIKKAVLSGEITAYNYNLNDHDDYSVPLTQKDLHQTLITDMKKHNEETDRDTTLHIEITPELIVGYELKEDWHFEKQRSVIDPRILWICPISISINGNTGLPDPTMAHSNLFWINFEQLRPFLAKTPVYNTKNDAEWRTFDDIFYKRQFASYVVQESNVFNRSIEQYYKGVDALLESDKIHDKIAAVEHDMWQY